MWKKHPCKFTFAFIIFSIFFIHLSLCPSMGRARDSSKSTLDNSKTLTRIQKLSIPFILNQGQVDKRVKFYARTFGGTVFVTENGEIVYSLQKTERDRKALKQKGKALKPDSKAVKELVLKEELVAGRVKEVKAEEEAITKVSHFIGNDSSKWRSNIPTYGLVSLGEVYEGIELKLKAYGNNVQKLFYVKSEAKPESIKVKIEGAKDLRVNKEGELEVVTDLGVVKFTEPVAYQNESATKKKYVKVLYTVNENEYSFKVGDYDKTKELVIDPLLASTFLGGGYHGPLEWATTEIAHAIAIDISGNVYVAGETNSSDFPTSLGAYDTSKNGYSDVFVAKFDSNLQNLLASTLLGSGDSDYAYSITIDSSGNVYVAGQAGSTYSPDFPTTPGAYNTTHNGFIDVFVAKFDSNLQNLLASTLLGGWFYEKASSISTDSSGSVYLAGKTGSGDFPTTPGAYDTTYNGYYDAFVVKFDSNLQNLLASTFLGGSGQNFGAHSIAIDSSGNVYVAGRTGEEDFPTTPGAYDTTYNGGYSNVFVAKFDSNLQNLLASTFLGGSNDTFWFIDHDYSSIAIDSSGNVYVAGGTASSDFPTTPGAYDTTYNGGYSDAFVAKFDSNLQNLIASTFLGGSNDTFSTYDSDCAYSIAIDSGGNVYVAGKAGASDFPITPGAYETTLKGLDNVFVSKFDANLENLLASAILGGGWLSSSMANHISIDSRGNVYVAGKTSSSGFPTTPDAYDTTYNHFSLYNVFVSKLDSRLAASIFSGVPSGYWADFDGDGATDVAAFHLPTDQFFTDYAGNLGQFGWGGSDSMPLIWDYDGDGKTDVSIYHIPTNQWFVKGYPGDNLGQFGWGGEESIPVPGDYNGDGVMERAFYHSPTNRWFVEGQDPVQFGWNGAECIPVPGDYDGDGKTDMALYHIPSNQWFIYGVGNLGQFGWGGADCIPVPGDWNGDGRMEIAVYHVPTNQWFWRDADGTAHFLGQYGWGKLESFPIPGDYNGDGTWERGFYRPSNNWWFIEGEPDFYWGWDGGNFIPITSQIAVYNWFRFVLGRFQ